MQSEPAGVVDEGESGTESEEKKLKEMEPVQLKVNTSLVSQAIEATRD